ncbi:hypothetical protein EDB84DRAFT_423293 [Lactarius hengduanensis]|nr:hypothetical protein EDB84DRAFT_423293 [Lactarius hengduanensis]
MKAKLKDCLAQRDLYCSNLAATESRLDRLQSRTVQAVYGRATSPFEAPAKDEEAAEKEEVDVKEEERASSSPAPTSVPAPPTPSFTELQEWQDIAKAREDKIRELESNNETLRHDNRVLTVSAPSSDIAGTEIFKILAERISHLEHTLKEKEAQAKIPSPEESKVLPNSESNDEELVCLAPLSCAL